MDSKDDSKMTGFDKSLLCKQEWPPSSINPRKWVEKEVKVDTTIEEVKEDE